MTKPEQQSLLVKTFIMYDIFAKTLLNLHLTSLIFVLDIVCQMSSTPKGEERNAHLAKTKRVFLRGGGRSHFWATLQSTGISKYPIDLLSDCQKSSTNRTEERIYGLVWQRWQQYLFKTWQAKSWGCFFCQCWTVIFHQLSYEGLTLAFLVSFLLICPIQIEGKVGNWIQIFFGHCLLR